jgi:hypothetical protein
MTSREEWIELLRLDFFEYEMGRDIATWGAYADWLEERDMEEHVFVRLLIKFFEEKRYCYRAEVNQIHWRFRFRFGKQTHVIAWYGDDVCSSGYRAGPNKRQMSPKEPYTNVYTQTLLPGMLT